MREFLTTGQVAALCSVTPDAVLKWVKAGKIPANRTPGGHYRIRRSDLPAILTPEEEISHARTFPDRPFQYCWEFNAKSGKGSEDCRQCIVYRSQTRRCYEMSQLPSESEHAKLFCTDSCDECEYYQLVQDQQLNILIVTDQPALRASVESEIRNIGYNLRFTDCEYNCSMLVEKYRPDYAILDCSMGTERARQFARHLAADLRIQFVRIILVGERHEFPTECDKEVFANIERPFTTAVMKQLISNLEREPDTNQ